MIIVISANQSWVNSKSSTLSSFALGKNPLKCRIIPSRGIVRHLSRKHPAPVWIRRTYDRPRAAVRTTRWSLQRVVFPDFCIPQVMRARDLPHTRTLLPVVTIGLFCARREPFREVATVNYEDRDSPAKRGRAEGQMLDFGIALLPENTVPPTVQMSKQD